MTCDEVSERLPWLLNGSLDETEANAVEDHLTRCAACREERQQAELAARLFAAHPTSADLVAHAFGDLAAVDAERVAAHVTTCAGCRDELELVAESRRQMSTGESGLGAAERSAAWLPLAASVALAMVAGAGWLWTWQQLESAGARWNRREAELRSEVERLQGATKSGQAAAVSPTPATAAAEERPTPSPDRVASLEREVEALRQPLGGLSTLELVPEEMVVRGEGAAPPLLPARSPATLHLIADRIVAGEQYVLSLAGPPSRPPWQATARAVKSGELSLYLPAESLPPGSYTLRLASLDRQVLGTYRFAAR